MWSLSLRWQIWVEPICAATARARRAARETGAIRLVAHPAVTRAIAAQDDWLAQLERQVGGTVALRDEASLGMAAGYAERA